MNKYWCTRLKEFKYANKNNIDKIKEKFQIIINETLELPNKN